MPEQPSERFPKSKRVVRQRDFDRCFKTGRVIADSVLVIHTAANSLSRPRLGISMSRKVGNAVVRNRWKRLIREAYRRLEHTLPGSIDYVVRPRKGAMADYESIYRSLASCGKRLSRRS
jgi:ribonuclease P protein component